MADDATNTAVAGVLGRLPAWPRKPLNSSVIAAEQAYRKRTGLPLLSDEDVEALKAGEQMGWERSEVSSATAPVVASAPVAPVATPAAAAPVSAATAAPASSTAQGVLGRLPALPRKPLNNSVISAEQAYRKRSGLPLLTDADVEGLKAGEPMPWERGGAVPTPAVASAPVPATTVAATAPSATAAVSTGGAPSAAVQELMKPGLKWSRSSIAAEQARRKRKGLAPLTDEDVAQLLGEQAPAAAQPVAPVAPAPPALAAPVAARPAAAPARAAVAAAPAAAQSVARTGTPTTYVGTPAVGTSKAAQAGGLASVGPEDTSVNQMRRRVVWACVAAFLTAWLLAFFRFFLPRTIFETSTVFKIGYPTDYGLGVDTKWQQKYRIWVDRTPDRLFVIYARCTHLGCTPDWKPSENKFKCPCHGSGYDSEGINFEGPAPRPMDRAQVDVAPDGQIQVNVAKLYSWPKGQPSHFNDPGSYIAT